jgi:hypothetical protein
MPSCRLILTKLVAIQITCLYDMDIPRPDNFNETYLYEGTHRSLAPCATREAAPPLTDHPP